MSKELSVIIPVHNEGESVAELHRELIDVLNSTGKSFEIIFIDDGSTDNTLNELKRLSPVRVISFSRNFGKSQALQAGFNSARGEYIITMDGDLQDDPREIPRFLEEADRLPSDLVCGWKKNRLDSKAKVLVSKVANKVTHLFTGTNVHDMNCGFKLYRRETAHALNLYGDMHRYIPALVHSHGFKVSEMPVNHRERKFGTSKYGNLRRLPKSAFDFVTLVLMRSFIDRPMHFFGMMGTISGFAGFIILVYLTYIKFAHNLLIGNRPLLMLGVLLIVIGVQLFSSGFLGELIIRQNAKRVLYVIREEIEQS